MSNRAPDSSALFKAAGLLESCRGHWNEPGHVDRLSEALRYNRRLWSLFHTELARGDSEMIPDLRTTLLRLGAFVERRTIEIMAEPERRKLEALIDISRHLAEGWAPPILRDSGSP